MTVATDTTLPLDNRIHEVSGSYKREDVLAAALKRWGENPSALISRLYKLCVEMEQILSAQLNAIIEAPEFCALEARWRGLQEVVWSKGKDQSVKIKLLDISWAELSEDLNYASDFRRSALANIIGQREFETLGGEPYGLLVLDHSLSIDVDTQFDELYTAQLLCDLGAVCVCPLVMGVNDDFFGEVDAAWYTDTRRLKNILSSKDYAAWQRLRQIPNARFLGLALPKCQLRGRYEDLDMGFRFHQWPSQSNGLWGTAATFFAKTAIAEFKSRAWFGFLKLVSGEQGTGATLARHDAPAPKGACPTLRARIRLTRATSHFYAEEGFIPIAESTKSNALYFVGNRSITQCGGNAEAEVLTQLQSVMIACRLVHYIKIQLRSLIGQVLTANECETILNDWLDKYVSTSSMGAKELQARYPLRGARIKISQSPSNTARLACEILLQPQYQIDHILGEICLSTDFRTTEGVAA
ncbi:type VI secretion system contractile sheath domain-containing protein [Flexibacterium corallicola]|uniref:type VI secretion system contractile sheath domain-containing protein n=1 Tax=Flexibacterium corallicola TaxID=3037259 RepID=UPI00286F2A73|nr:type VI secretion system contractile sheath large subunit [Pseudovibrio sp. M1P-2-3]